jgi:acyl-CoA synthetase (NDP forming)
MSMDALFNPRSVAVYGASARREEALGNVLLRNATAASLPVVAVHPRAEHLEGVPAYTSLTGIGDADLALISVPSAGARDAVRDAAEAGCRAAVVLSSGFGETDADGRRLQDEMVSTARAADMRLVGPNCMGVVSRQPVGALFNGSYFWDVPTQPSSISFVSQSGAMGGMFLDQVRRREAGLARFLSIGNAADVGVTETLGWLADDPETSAIGMFIEGIDDGPRFVEAATRATERKPVIALKGGRHASGARAAASHTGALAGAYGPVRAAFLRAGVEAATSTRELFDRLFSAEVPSPSDRRVAVITVSGGPSVVAADAVTDHGLLLADLEEETQRRIRAHVPRFAAVGNPVDLTPQCDPSEMAPAVAAVYDDPQVDAAVIVNCGLNIPEFGEAIAEALGKRALPTAAFLLDVPAVAGPLRAAGVPLLGSPEDAVATVASAWGRRS